MEDFVLITKPARMHHKTLGQPVITQVVRKNILLRFCAQSRREDGGDEGADTQIPVRGRRDIPCEGLDGWTTEVGLFGIGGFTRASGVADHGRTRYKMLWAMAPRPVLQKPGGAVGEVDEIIDGIDYSLQSKRSGNAEIKSQKHGYSIGSSTANAPIKPPEARSPFPDFFNWGL
ncbi:hypothetical protein HOY80DRAFT_1033609 [Tuber brumale]|nr:hypothetical protein HOY80DRAFT_1033609 [Tuber brumale]